jgi:flavin-dependent dehydrogenase
MTAEESQVVIVGAGVSGSSTAIRLRQRGITPLVLDKAEFPRDTTGEGLSPAVSPFLEELGLLDEINKPPFVKKRSLQLVSHSGDRAYGLADLTREPFRSGQHRYPWGFNVHRLRFDMLFQEKARAMGADVRLKTEASRFLTDDSGAITGVELVEPDGGRRLVRTPLVIDCSGRQSALAQQLGLRAPLERVFEGQWANFAVRCHFQKVNLEPLSSGNSAYDPATVNIFPDRDSWYWFIPLDLDAGLISIGFVARSKMCDLFDSADKRGAYLEMFRRNPVLARVIDGAEMSDNIATTARLGHMNTRMAGPGFLCVGDAAFFPDPAWGTGVTVALKTSKMAAEVAIQAIGDGDFGPASMARYEEEYRRFIINPFNSIRAYNYYYNDTEYVNFLVRRLAQSPRDMDLIVAVLFDYISHESFQSWTFREFKAYVRETGRVPIMDRVSQLDFDSASFARRGPAVEGREGA